DPAAPDQDGELFCVPATTRPVPWFQIAQAAGSFVHPDADHCQIPVSTTLELTVNTVPSVCVPPSESSWPPVAPWANSVYVAMSASPDADRRHAGAVRRGAGDADDDGRRGRAGAQGGVVEGGAGVLAVGGGLPLGERVGGALFLRHEVPRPAVRVAG